MDDKKTLRNFGLLVGGVFLLMGLTPLYRGHDMRTWAVTVGACLIALGLAKPIFLKRPYMLWMKFGRVLMIINTRIILVLLFFLIVCPIGLLLRLSGKDLLRVRKTENGYWLPRHGPTDPKSYERMF